MIGSTSVIDESSGGRLFKMEVVAPPPAPVRVLWELGKRIGRSGCSSGGRWDQ